MVFLAWKLQTQKLLTNAHAHTHQTNISMLIYTANACRKGSCTLSLSHTTTYIHTQTQKVLTNAHAHTHQTNISMLIYTANACREGSCTLSLSHTHTYIHTHTH